MARRAICVEAPSLRTVEERMKTRGHRTIGDIRFRKDFLVLALMLTFLCACGAGTKNESERQTIAKVNGDLITVRELNDQFSRIEARAAPDKKIWKRQVLDALVDEKLLAQQASENRLDREPETIMALDRARRQVLAQAAIDHESRGRRVNQGEIKAFYESYPDLFERRRTYVFRRYDLLARELQPSLKAELDKAGSPLEVGLILKRAKVRFSDQTEIRPAEMLTADVLKKVVDMKRGDILIFREAGPIVLMQLISSIAEPIDLAHATPGIRDYLADRRKKTVAEMLLKDLRHSAKIEYSQGLIDGFQAQSDARSFESVGNVAIGRSANQVNPVSRP